MDGSDSTDRADESASSAETEIDSALRRRLLASAASTSALATAGCLGLLGDRSETGPRPGKPTPYEDTETDTETPGGTTTPGSVEEFDIEWLVEEATISVASDESLLSRAQEEDLDPPYQCERGICGVCTSSVDGDGTEYVEHDGNQYLSDEQIEAGYILTCVGYPKQDFSLETGKQEAADSVGEGGETEEPTTTPGDVASYSVEYVEQGGTIDVQSDESLLVAGEDEGWSLPNQCRHGVCGQCTSKVEGEGETTDMVEHDGNQYLSDEQIDEGYVLTCVGYARDDFSLITGKQDEADQV